MKYVSYVLLFIFAGFSAATCAQAPALYPVLLSNTDQPSLQRGAKIYVNYCSGCHSLNYLRYNQLAKDLGVVGNDGQLLSQLVAQDLIFTGDKITDAIKVALPTAAAKHWFGKVPPDLSLLARVKGGDWLYTFLRSFYKDTGRPWGTNNRLLPNVAMPNVLLELQGVQIPVYKYRKDNQQTLNDISHLVLIQPGSLSPQQFNASMTDLVNFLVFVSEPMQAKRERLGFWVLAYFLLLVAVLGALYKSYWKRLT